MTRIVAGRAGGRPLKVPAKGTRPTSERVREALFSRLDHMGILTGAAVLDLYAGSGALGMEALSRGARRATFVEKSRPATTIIKSNLHATDLAALGSVVCADVSTYITHKEGASLSGDYDVIFIDPPYDMAATDLNKVLAHLGPWMHPDTLVIVEASSRAPEPAWPTDLVLEERRAYGETIMWFAGPPVLASDDAENTSHDDVAAAEKTEE
ncbi:16S rRNA (guanine(966)-N(2))-methyltransferase RsmD [Schaalia sp. Marseille-Q2122]|uniref:16S rRNA (guanine(966)-N(2))-methyltransferase RsmD n=1 Tax=Schaalia sp. Marseille-Q2122 TaxID=2736604 RepID=UPI00158BB70B|nr:16S rRNA (guanine(966)-N(2))-methyltransferase RsmD [Schaalia sp. Marseille-Q2122]